MTAVAALPLLLSLFALPLESPYLLPKRALLIVAAAVLAAVGTVGGRVPRRRDIALPAWLALAAAAAVLLSWTLSADRALSCVPLLFWLSGPLLAFVMVCAPTRGQQPFVAGIAAAGTLQAALAAAQWLAGPAVGRMRMYGTLGNPDFVAIFVAATLPWAIIGARRRRDGRTGAWTGEGRLWGLAVALDLLAVAATGSRTGAASAAVAIVVTAWCMRGGRAESAGARQVATVTALVLVAGAAGALLVARTNPRSLVEAFEGRTTIWRVVLAANGPTATGRGPGTFPQAYDVAMSAYAQHHPGSPLFRYFEYESTALNDFVQLIVETGWMAAVCLAGCLAVWCIRVGRRIGDEPGQPSLGEVRGASLATVAALCVASLADSPFQRAETWALLWIALALPFAGAVPIGRRRGPAGWLMAGVASAAVVMCLSVTVPSLVASWWRTRGEASESRGAYRSAIDAYRHAVHVQPADSAAWFDLARALARERQYEAALDALGIAVRGRPEPETALLRARILQAEGATPYAVRELAAAVERYPWRRDLWIELGRLTAKTDAR